MKEKHCTITALSPADRWAHGYPVGNGKTAAMALGGAEKERIALNYGPLWRNYLSYQPRYAAEEFPRFKALCQDKKWDEAQELILKKIPWICQRMLYVNGYAPAGDLYISHIGNRAPAENYKRTLDLSTGVARTTYQLDGVQYAKEVRCLHEPDVMLVRLSTDTPATLRGCIGLAREQDPTCQLDGYSHGDIGVMNGTFEEGGHFTVAYRVVARGGRLTGFSQAYRAKNPIEPGPVIDQGMALRDETVDNSEDGIHTYFDSMDEVFVVVGVAVDADCAPGQTTEQAAIEKIDALTGSVCLFREHDTVCQKQENEHRRYFDRVSLDLQVEERLPDDVCLQQARRTGEVSRQACENLFNMGRYIAITAGYPMGGNAPINLQGLWCQDLYAPWEADYHLDLNVQMAYWSLTMAGLPELYEPLLQWALKLMPEAEKAAKDLYGCRGVYFSTQNDFHHVGNVSDMMYYWTGAAAWLAQTLYLPYAHTQDEAYLRRLYPLLKSVAEFYEDFLTEVGEELHPIPSASMEAGILGRRRWSCLSSPSAMDLELIHWALTCAADTAEQLQQDVAQSKLWRAMEKRVPFPVVDKEGCLQEWLEAHAIEDPAHRHRSGLIGLCPGDRINCYETPQEWHAARKALDMRQNGPSLWPAGWTLSWDVQLEARLHHARGAQQNLHQLLSRYSLDNYMLTINAWDSDEERFFPHQPVIQVDASLSVIAGIIECIVQERGGVLCFLPALPSDWPTGSLTGICLNAGLVADVFWADGKLTRAVLHSPHARTVTYCSENGELREIKIAAGEHVIEG
ncbi:MAG: glycoside hydrolase N-terminal domain-containing protein [Clostridia bacterium]|nr:glycoside hydrolase N-terminal domain-containing protein [Clostridia bacterium]